MLIDPTKTENYEDEVIEENLKMLLINDVEHANFENSFKKREVNMITKKTTEMLNKMKEKSEA